MIKGVAGNSKGEEGEGNIKFEIDSEEGNMIERVAKKSKGEEEAGHIGIKGVGMDTGVTTLSVIREVIWGENSTPCSLVIDIKVEGVDCEEVIDSRAQVSVVSRNFWKSMGRGEVVDTVKLKGATQDIMMAGVVERVDIETGDVRRNIKVFVADISDDCIFGLDRMKQFQMVVDLNKGVIG